ncbi:MAG: hypothetical protein Q4F00_07820, partial [bacterium]|nr:hypothetical protein [bacterium]
MWIDVKQAALLYGCARQVFMRKLPKLLTRQVPNSNGGRSKWEIALESLPVFFASPFCIKLQNIFAQ